MAFRESVTKLELKKGKAVMTYTNGDRVTIFDPVIMMVKSTIFEEYPNRYADPVPVTDPTKEQWSASVYIYFRSGADQGGSKAIFFSNLSPLFLNDVEYLDFEAAESAIEAIIV